MAVASKARESPLRSLLKVKKGRPKKTKENVLTCKKVVCTDPGISKCEKRKRATYNDLYDNEEVSSAVMERAKEVQANLAPEFPSLIKGMLHSHVTRGFWLGLPRKFCDEHMPKQDTAIILEDEDGVEFETKYLGEKVGLSAGWRGFSIAHKIMEGDVVVFQLVTPSKFKVYIVKYNGSEEVDGALSLLQLVSETNARLSEEEDNYWEPLAQDIPLENSGKETLMIDNVEHVSDQSVSDRTDIVPEVLDGIKISESTIEFKEVKSIDDFNIVVNGLIINSMLPKHVQTKYYELCLSQNSFLHDSLLEDLNCRLVAGIIGETINIADAIRASKLATSQDNFSVWDKTLKAFKLMGMNVGFLQDRLDQLVNLVSGSKRIEEARLERAHAEEEDRILKVKLLEVRKKMCKLDHEIETLEMDTGRLEVMFQGVAKAPW